MGIIIYDELHKFCPKCGQRNLQATCVGYIKSEDNPNTYTCWQRECGFKGKQIRFN